MVAIMCCQITFVFEDGVNLYCLQQYYTWITEAHFSESFMSSALFSFDLVCKLLLKIFFQNKPLFTPPSESSPGGLSPLCQFRYKFLNPSAHHLTSILIVLQTICEAASLQVSSNGSSLLPLSLYSDYFVLQNCFFVNISQSHLISKISSSTKLSMQNHL